MSTLIFDIETVGESYDEFDEVTKEALTHWIIQNARSEEEKSLALENLKSGLGFSPLTGFIVALGIYDIERGKGTVYYQSETAVEDYEEGLFTYRVRSEKAMLESFWEGVTYYETLVTFNGRAFDVPFLLHRSVVQQVVPTIDLMRYRYLTQQNPPYHIDLQDQLTFYGAMTKRPSLHMFCQAYGITSPKSHGVSGNDVAALFYAKKSRDIAVYNSYDLLATAALYDKWQTYLAPPLFRKADREINI